jgi:hypothetical protein
VAKCYPKTLNPKQHIHEGERMNEMFPLFMKSMDGLKALVSLPSIPHQNLPNQQSSKFKEPTPNCWFGSFPFFHETFCWFLEIFQKPKTRRGSLILRIFKKPKTRRGSLILRIFEKPKTRRGSLILRFFEKPSPEVIFKIKEPPTLEIPRRIKMKCY